MTGTVSWVILIPVTTQHTEKKQRTDVLGLDSLGGIIDRLEEHARAGRAGEAAGAILELASVWRGVRQSYSGLRDRYCLLKQSNRHLADEVAWLRDHVDDFAGERAELGRRIAASVPRTEPGAPPARRLEDRT